MLVSMKSISFSSAQVRTSPSSGNPVRCPVTTDRIPRPRRDDNDQTGEQTNRHRLLRCRVPAPACHARLGTRGNKGVKQYVGIKQEPVAPHDQYPLCRHSVQKRGRVRLEAAPTYKMSPPGQSLDGDLRVNRYLQTERPPPGHAGRAMPQPYASAGISAPAARVPAI